MNVSHLLICDVVCKKHKVNTENCTQVNPAMQECTKCAQEHPVSISLLATSVYHVCCEPHPVAPNVTTSHLISDTILFYTS